MSNSASGNFDWESIKAISITPKYQSIPNSLQIQIPKTAVEIFFGKTPVVKSNSMSVMINGMEIDLSKDMPSFNFNMNANNNLSLSTQPEKVLNLKLDNGDFQFVDLTTICIVKLDFF